MAARPTPGPVGVVHGAGHPAGDSRDIAPFAPYVAITYVFITPALAFPFPGGVSSVFNKRRDQAVTARHGAELALPAVNKHDSPFVASMDAAHVRSSHRHSGRSPGTQHWYGEALATGPATPGRRPG